MSPQARVSLFVAGLAVVLVAGFGLGSVVDKAETETGASHGELARHGEEEMAMGEHGGHGAEASAPAGLAIAADGYSLHLLRPFVDAVASGELRFRIEGATGEPVREYDRLHEREMHLIIVRRDGAPVTGLQSYLGAKGHLVALREGDLAFLHVHPEETADPDAITFSGHFPTPGRYRLYLQFKHAGQVRTAEFTVEVER